MTDMKNQMVKNKLSQYLSINEIDLHFLGEGDSSIIFHDSKFVYKIIFLKKDGYQSDYFYRLANIFSRFDDSCFFYKILEIFKLDHDIHVIKYHYEKSEPCLFFEEKDKMSLILFFAECWYKKVIFQDIKPSNFIRVDGMIKWIDYEVDKYTDNLFLNMITRGFIFYKYRSREQTFLKKLTQSAINHFDMTELDGLHEFINEVFISVIYHEFKSKNHYLFNLKNEMIDEIDEDFNGISDHVFKYKIKYDENLNFDQLCVNAIKNKMFISKISPCEINQQNLFLCPKFYEIELFPLKKTSRPISVMIKACPQDIELLEQSILHIFKQLHNPNYFDEIVLSIDYKEGQYLREFNDFHSLDALLTLANRLKEKGLIDKVVYLTDENTIQTINLAYFGVPTVKTHTKNGAPLTAQLYGFEQCKNPFILQMDCDVILGRLDQNHSFIEDMIQALVENPKANSVGFNIYKGMELSTVPYHSDGLGGYVPEVRFCLLDRDRIASLLPLTNQYHEEAGFELTWFRALEKKQAFTNSSSLRGGASHSFYIHPQNFRKNQLDSLFTIVDLVEQSKIPPIQKNQFDLVGSYYDWTKLNTHAQVYIVSCFRNLKAHQFLRFWMSILSQDFKDWHLILVDDASDNGLTSMIYSLVKENDRVTFIRNRFRMGSAHNIYKAIHYFIKNQEAVIMLVDADDALIGSKCIQNVMDKYDQNGADLVIGKMYRTDKLNAHYQYTPDFINPRLYGGNVWQHLKSFRKYLFDSLNFDDLKIELKNDQKQIKENYIISKKYSSTKVFPEYCFDYTIMIPMVELSSRPMQINQFNYFFDPSTKRTIEVRQRKNEIIEDILKKKSKSPEDVVRGRRSFLPNLKQIEIDITYDCNLKCLNCNRSCTQAPTKDHVSLEQIDTFIEESIELGYQWKLINILGGEPTLHPSFDQIIQKILNYIDLYSPQTILQLTSNGYGEFVKEKLNALPKHKQLMLDYASFKDDKVVEYFSPFNDAPLDDLSGSHAFEKGCWVTSYCGIGLNHLGYYPCAVAGGIDRVFHFQKGIQKLADVELNVKKMLKDFCGYCGNFKDYEVNQGDFIPRHEKNPLHSSKISKTWQTQYRSYNKKKLN